MSKCELNDYENKPCCVSISKTLKENEPLKGRGYNMKMTHKHNHYEILNVYSADNNVTLYIYNKKYVLPPNSFVLVPPYTPHCVERNFHSNRLLLNFSADFGEKVFDFLDIDIQEFFSNSVLSYSPKQISELYSIGKKMITDYLKTHYSAHITLDELAEKFKMNKFSLCKKFRRETDLSVVDFLNQIRVNHARDLLENSSMRMDEITAKTGFESVAYFSRVFKNYTGISPTAYRKNFLRSHAVIKTE